MTALFLKEPFAAAFGKKHHRVPKWCFFLAGGWRPLKNINPIKTHYIEWWCQGFVIFTPKIGEDSQFDYYFSDGLKPPTSYIEWVFMKFHFCFSTRKFSPPFLLEKRTKDVPLNSGLGIILICPDPKICWDDSSYHCPQQIEKKRDPGDSSREPLIP